MDSDQSSQDEDKADSRLAKGIKNDHGSMLIGLTSIPENSCNSVVTPAVTTGKPFFTAEVVGLSGLGSGKDDS